MTTTLGAHGHDTVPAERAPRPWAGWLLLAAAGLVTMLALPPWGWWPLAPVGLAVLYHWTGRAPSWQRRVGGAWLFWGTGNLLGLWWISEITIPGYAVSVPLLALVTALPTVAVPPAGSWRPSAFPAAVVAGEAWRVVFPFGGAPMSGLALGQLEAPWADAARIGTHLLIVAVVCAVAVAGIEAAERHWVAAVGAGAFVVLAAVAGMVAPDGDRTGQITAAVVQGGGPLGTRAVDTPDEIVWERHVEATRLVTPEADLVLWPETVDDVDRPLETSDRVAELGMLATELDATFAVGLNELEGDIRLNVLVAVGPDGTLVDRYDKVHLVPFGEYVPLRSFVDRFADLSVIGTEIEPGKGQALLVTPAGPLAPAISFEIYFHDRVREGVQLGAELVVNSTLASSYTTSLIAEQTLASGRLRAIETGRWVLQASTTGYSAVIDHRGDVVDRTGLREQAVLELPVDRRRGETWAVRFGQWPITVVALVLLSAPWVGPAVRATRSRLAAQPT